MNDLPAANQHNTHQAPPPKRLAIAARWFGFFGMMCVCFFLGFYFIGPRLHRTAAPSVSSDKVDLGDNDDWGQAPAPITRRKDSPKPTAAVEVNEISPNDKPTEATTTVSAPVGENDVTTQLSPSPEPTPSDAGSSGAPQRKRYYVQLGVYADKTNAEIVSANLADHGYASSVRQVLRNGVPHYQVAVGNPKDHAAADALAAELKGAGHDVVVMPE